MSTIDLVQEFHEKFGHPVATKIADLPAELRALRVRLIAEELAELCRAWGVRLGMLVVPDVPETEDDPDITCCQIEPLCAQDHVEAADALGDLDYVVAGANLVAGYPAKEVLAEIHRSNMSKLGADGKPIVRADGKILKGPNYFKPNIARILTKPWGGRCRAKTGG